MWRKSNSSSAQPPFSSSSINNSEVIVLTEIDVCVMWTDTSPSPESRMLQINGPPGIHSLLQALLGQSLNSGTSSKEVANQRKHVKPMDEL